MLVVGRGSVELSSVISDSMSYISGAESLLSSLKLWLHDDTSLLKCSESW